MTGTTEESARPERSPPPAGASAVMWIGILTPILVFMGLLFWIWFKAKLSVWRDRRAATAAPKWMAHTFTTPQFNERMEFLRSFPGWTREMDAYEMFVLETADQILEATSIHWDIFPNQADRVAFLKDGLMVHGTIHPPVGSPLSHPSQTPLTKDLAFKFAACVLRTPLDVWKEHAALCGTGTLGCPQLGCYAMRDRVMQEIYQAQGQRK